MPSRIRAHCRGTLKGGAVIAVGALAIGLLYAYLGLHNPYVGFQADDALYLLMADIYSPRIEAALPVYGHVKAYSQLPPLFPLLLGMFGAGSDNLPAARLFVAVSMLGANLSFYAWLRMVAVPHGHALALATIQAILPITLIHVVDIWSEGLYLCFTFLALIAMRYAEKTHFTVAACLAVGVAVGCALATRTVGLALLPAMLLLGYRSNPKSVALMCLSLGLFLALITRIDMGDAGLSYSALLRSSFGDDTLTRLFAHLESTIAVTWHAFAYDLFQWRALSITQNAVLSAALVLALIGFARSIRSAPYSVVYIASYCPIIAIWPFPDLMDRFVFAILPFWFYFAYSGAVLLGARLKSRTLSPAALFIGAVFALAAPSMVDTGRQLLRPFPETEFETFRTTRYWLDSTRSSPATAGFAYMKGLHDSLGDITRHVPANECVHSVLPNIVLLKSKRIAWPPVSEDRIRSGDLGPCRYFYVTPKATHSRPSMFPYSLIKGQTDTLAVYRYGDAQSDTGTGQIVGILLAQRPRSSAREEK